MNVTARLLAFAFALTLALGGCGGTSDSGLSAAARAELAPLVAQVRHAAESHDLGGTERALTALQRAVASYRDDGEIGSARATQILAAAARVRNNLALVPTTVAATTTTTTLPERPGHGKKGKGDEDQGGKGKD